ncbi:unnamed protein product, partial [Iphiclides podalirius]
MEYSLFIALACLALPLVYAAPKPITIYTSEPIKLEQIPEKKAPEPVKPKPVVETIPFYTTAFFHTLTTEKPVEKKEKQEIQSYYNMNSLPPLYALYGPYYGMLAMRPVAVVPKPLPPFYYRMKMFYQMLG